MIDTHCHLLPAIDDGPDTMRGSLELARAFVDAGVHTAVCTPHFSRRYPTDRIVAEQRLSRLVAELERAQVPLQVELAAELGSAAAVEAPASTLRQRRLGHSHLLVELEADTPASVVEIVVRRLRLVGLRPIFGHPERCRAVRSHPRVLDSARSEGALLQVVAPSLTGRGGGSAASFAWGLLASGRADLLASDAHNARHASGHLTEALAMVSRRLGESRLIELTETRPARLI